MASSFLDEIKNSVNQSYKAVLIRIAKEHDLSFIKLENSTLGYRSMLLPHTTRVCVQISVEKPYVCSFYVLSVLVGVLAVFLFIPTNQKQRSLMGFRGSLGWKVFIPWASKDKACYAGEKWRYLLIHTLIREGPAGSET